MVESSNKKQIATPDLTALMLEARRDFGIQMNCIQVGVVESFDPATQTANVKIAMKQVESISDDGVKTLRDYPLLVRCPCFIFSGGNDFIGMPIQAGDDCLILFNDRDIGAWQAGGDGNIPNTSRIHDLSDAFCLVGVRPLANAILNYLSNGIRISHNGGNTQIDLVDNLIHSTAQLWQQTGNMQIDGNLTINGDTYGDSLNNINLKANLRQQTGRVMEAGNGATGTFERVTVVKGIVTGGS